MAYEPSCAVCGHSVPMDTNHAAVKIETVLIDDRNQREDYYLHDRCARAVFDGWTEP